MKHVLIIVLGLAASPAFSQDTKVLLCTAETQLNLSSGSLDPVPSDETYTWELNYQNGELVSLAAPFDCIDDTEDWTIGETVISLECKQGAQDIQLSQIFAEIDRYAQSFVVSGISTDPTGATENEALWLQEGKCELARRKF